jgi:hypothetical protein
MLMPILITFLASFLLGEYVGWKNRQAYEVKEVKLKQKLLRKKIIWQPSSRSFQVLS